MVYVKFPEHLIIVTIVTVWGQNINLYQNAAIERHRSTLQKIKKKGKKDLNKITLHKLA